MLKLIASIAVGTTLCLAATSAFAAAPTQAQMVQEVYDRQMILQLMADYGFAMDDSNGDAFAKLFTPDGVLIAGGGETFKGAEALKKLGDSAGQRQVVNGPAQPLGYPIKHLFANVSMDIRGDNATVKANWIVVNGRTSTPTPQSMGHYEDKLVKRNGRWIYTERRIINETMNRPAPGK